MLTGVDGVADPSAARPAAADPLLALLALAMAAALADRLVVAGVLGGFPDGVAETGAEAGHGFPSFSLFSRSFFWLANRIRLTACWPASSPRPGIE